MAKKVKSPFVGIDLGGTKVLAAIVSPKGRVVARAKNLTPDREGPEAVIAVVTETVRQALQKAEVKPDEVAGIGIGTPGLVDASTGIVRYAPNLAGWDEVPLGPALHKALGRPVIVGNDVDVSTFGEYAVGAGAGCNSVVGIFPGTGIGGALILNGRLHTGMRGSASELGHIVLMADGPLCGCGRRGCAEALASRTALERDLRAAIRFGQETALRDLIDDSDDHIRSGVLAQAARMGDRLMLETLQRTGYYLGLLAGSIVNVIDPEMVIFGGGLIEACQEWLMPTIRNTARQYFINRLDIDRVKMETALLGDDAGVLGAAMLARSTFGEK